MTLDRQDVLTGALVADAASLGLHWLYDQAHIKTVEASGDVLFRAPDKAVYAGRKGVFAHAGKRPGDLSQYGESARVTGQLLAEKPYKVSDHQRAFFDAFGPCGSYVGYADRPTKALVARIITDGRRVPAVSGIEDDQMPALCAVPGLFAAGYDLDTMREAVKVVSIDEDVDAALDVIASCLTRLADGVDLKTALRESAGATSHALSGWLAGALDHQGDDPVAVAAEFGLTCHIKEAMPVIWYLLNRAENYTDLVRDNIRCGGDSCGRTMALGAIAGFAFGVPDELAARLPAGLVPVVAQAG